MNKKTSIIDNEINEENVPQIARLPDDAIDAVYYFDSVEHSDFASLSVDNFVVDSDGFSVFVGFIARLKDALKMGGKVFVGRGIINRERFVYVFGEPIEKSEQYDIYEKTI